MTNQPESVVNPAHTNPQPPADGQGNQQENGQPRRRRQKLGFFMKELLIEDRLDVRMGSQDKAPRIMLLHSNEERYGVQANPEKEVQARAGLKDIGLYWWFGTELYRSVIEELLKSGFARHDRDYKRRLAKGGKVEFTVKITTELELQDDGMVEVRLSFRRLESNVRLRTMKCIIPRSKLEDALYLSYGMGRGLSAINLTIWAQREQKPEIVDGLDSYYAYAQEKLEDTGVNANPGTLEVTLTEAVEAKGQANGEQESRPLSKAERRAQRRKEAAAAAAARGEASTEAPAAVIATVGATAIGVAPEQDAKEADKATEAPAPIATQVAPPTAPAAASTGGKPAEAPRGKRRGGLDALKDVKLGAEVPAQDNPRLEAGT